LENATTLVPFLKRITISDCPSQSQSHEELSPNYDLIDPNEKARMISGGGGGTGGGVCYKTHSLKLKGTKSVGGEIFLDDGDPAAAAIAYYESSMQMLPIFQRLIEDKKGVGGVVGGDGGSEREDGRSSGFKNKSKNAASCPDISLRCDIVEYL
jgi:hypothetical protein